MPRGAKRDPQPDFVLPRDRTAQDQVRDVRARHEQHEADRAEQNQQRTPHLA
jgi:hypothetical protein